MSTRSNVLRLAVFGLLITRAPRSVQRVLGYMLMGVAIAVIWIVLAVTARSQQYDSSLRLRAARPRAATGLSATIPHRGVPA